ncbi:MAG TPA: endonuclease [Verrucomicrobia bacterium]|nr:MAG: endonuclease [Lentisphaerae bacterium GWF2_57_35]HBA84773.1 endonuclease [Verrucomicrobiota bacterium]
MKEKKARPTKRKPLNEAFDRLLERWGPQHWWPGETDIEIIAGAILTQNTAWANVEKAIRRLKEEKALSLEALHRTPLETLAQWIRPAGYHNVKARRLRAFTTLVTQAYEGRLDKLLAEETDELRRVLLRVNGIGPETADSILLYVARRPVFVVDAYTRRVLLRHRWIRESDSYDEVAALFRAQLSNETALFNEYHALIVALGKQHCRPTPQCGECPLRELLPPGGAA